MHHQQDNPVWLYLPLLVNPEPVVRRQACLIMLGLYGDRALTLLRRLLDDPDPAVRQDARLAQMAVAEITGGAIKLQPFRGIYIECLGRLRVYVGHHELGAADWVQAEGGRAGGQKVQSLFAYLIHCGRRGASREALGAAVWGGPASAGSVARTLTALRQALARHTGDPAIVERALVIERDFCTLDPDCYHTDVQLFERAYGMAVQLEQEGGLGPAAPIYGHALQLYSGPYMAGVAPGSGWGRRRRDHLMSSFVLAAERLAEHAYTRRQFRECISLCLLALDADPTADDLVAWLLRAYAAEGQRADLEHAFRSYMRAAGLDPLGDGAPADVVVQAYRELGLARAR